MAAKGNTSVAQADAQPLKRCAAESVHVLPAWICQEMETQVTPQTPEMLIRPQRLRHAWESAMSSLISKAMPPHMWCTMLEAVHGPYQTFEGSLGCLPP